MQAYLGPSPGPWVTPALPMPRLGLPAPERGGHRPVASSRPGCGHFSPLSGSRPREDGPTGEVTTWDGRPGGLPTQVPGRDPPEGHKPALCLLLEVQGSSWMMDSLAVSAGHRGMPAMNPWPRGGGRAVTRTPGTAEHVRGSGTPRGRSGHSVQCVPGSSVPPRASSSRRSPQTPREQNHRVANTSSPRPHLGKRQHLLAAPGPLGCAHKQNHRQNRRNAHA